MACYSFEPKADIPLKMIVLDDTLKGTGQANFAQVRSTRLATNGW